MVIAYHIVFAAYGFWPPNDQRGSWSERVWADHLQPFGPTKKVYTRESLARVKSDPKHRRAIQASMKFPPVVFNGVQALAVAHGVREVCETIDLIIFACSIMPNHVHLVVLRHNANAETLIGYLKRAATKHLTREGIHPMGDAIRNRDGASVTPWVRGGWKRFLNDDDEICDAVVYVRRNPSFSGLRPQQWSFEQPID